MKFKHIRTGAILEPHSDFVLEQFQKSPDLIPFDDPEPVAAPGDGDKPLSKFTKDELLEMAQEAGIAVPDGAKKGGDHRPDRSPEAELTGPPKGGLSC